MNGTEVCAAIDCMNRIEPTGRKRFCSRRCQLTARNTPPERTQVAHSATRRWFGVRCLECESDDLTRTTQTSEIRSPATHRAEILTCVCGLEMLLAVDLSRINDTRRRTQAA